MSTWGAGLAKAALSAIHFTGVDNLAMPRMRGTGAVFMLHHVLPAMPLAFAPNKHLEVTPEFLERTIQLVLDRGYDVISLDDAAARLAEGTFDRPFVCFTFDDGYRDTIDHAYPVFRRHGLPFAIYVVSDFADGRGDLWWLALELLLRQVDAIAIKLDGVVRHFPCQRPNGKTRAYNAIYRWLKRLPEPEAREIVADLCRVHGIDARRQCSELLMGWDELRELAKDPLVTIGAHTRSHLALAALSYADARFEIETSITRIEREIGRPCRHFSFPYGDVRSASQREFELAREAGLATAVTAREGLLKSDHGRTPTALPRIALSGDFQKARYVKVLLSGVPFALGRSGGLGLPSPVASAPA
jgi:peptidoglycan/xylan/chitin deacetylase (PgdA/CDA1 family)